MQIDVTGATLVQLKVVRNAVLKELGVDNVTWNIVVAQLLIAWNENKALKSKVASKDSKIDALKDNRGDEMKELLVKMIDKPISMPMMGMQQPQMQFNGPAQNFIGTTPPPPPLSAPPSGPPRLPERVTIQRSKDVKNDFTKEIKQVFNNSGDSMLKPSDILKLCSPSHAEAKIIEVEEVPELIEHDKNFYKVEEQKEVIVYDEDETSQQGLQELVQGEQTEQEQKASTEVRLEGRDIKEQEE